MPCKLELSGKKNCYSEFLIIIPLKLNATCSMILAAVMSDASICGLGHTASSAVRSALDLGLLENKS